MFSTVAGNNLLYKGAALYATTTAFAAFWIGLRLPVQSNKAGPYNYHKIIKQGRRVPWRRLPKMVPLYSHLCTPEERLSHTSSTLLRGRNASDPYMTTPSRLRLAEKPNRILPGITHLYYALLTGVLEVMRSNRFYRKITPTSDSTPSAQDLNDLDHLFDKGHHLVDENYGGLHDACFLFHVC